MSTKENDVLLDDLENWLMEQGRKTGDVMDDGEGYYILINGSEDEDEFVKRYLPDNFQELNI